MGSVAPQPDGVHPVAVQASIDHFAQRLHRAEVELAEAKGNLALLQHIADERLKTIDALEARLAEG